MKPRDYTRLAQERERYFKGWAALVDFGVEAALGNLQLKKDFKSSLNELKVSLSNESEEHLRALCNMLKRMR